MPHVYIPVGAERAVRRRIRSRSESTPVSTVASHRARPTRRLRRILARSRSAGSCTRERSLRHAYERSHSCPEYPVYTNTYKITDNKKDYVFHMALSRLPKPTLITTLSLNRDQRTLPENVYYGPVPSKSKILIPHKTNVQHEPESCKWHSDNTINDDINQQLSLKTTRRRRLPNVESLPNPRVRLLPKIPTVDKVQSFDTEFNQNYNLINNTAVSTKRDDNISQYHGYGSEGSEAETTIHVSIERQNTLDVETSKLYKKLSFETNDLNSLHKNEDESNPGLAQISRKKFLSLDLKSNYDQRSPNQTDYLDDFNKQTKEVVKSSPKKYLPKEDKIINRPKNLVSTRRRNSDSLVILKSSPQGLSTPDQIKNMFKRMSITSKNTSLDMSTENITSDNKDKSTKKCGNTVSINEVPTFQEYRSPNSLSPQSSIDLSYKKPLPSIIKKARTRSYSLAATDHLDREFSIIANSISIALSPPNLGSPRRVLTPDASHLPHDDSHQNIHDTTIEPTATDEPNACTTPPTSLSTCPRNYYRRDTIHNLQQTMKQFEKPSQRRTSKRSNDYGGRENGRGNNQQQQPLERRESRRGQFTRSLSNADVPPDEKAGNI